MKLSKKKNLGFVTGGLLSGYYINDKGKDSTSAFIKENEWATDYPSLLIGKSVRRTATATLLNGDTTVNKGVHFITLK